MADELQILRHTLTVAAILAMFIIAGEVPAQSVRQASSATPVDDGVAPLPLGSLPTISLPDKKDKPFSLPINTSLGFVGGDTLSMTSVKVGTNLPIWFSKDKGCGSSNGGPDMMVTAGLNFGADFLDSTAMLDVPDTLFSAGGSLTVMKRLNERWRMMSSINVSYKGDGEATDHVVNISGMGMLTWHKSEQMQWVFGVAVTGQQNFPVVPLVGFTWKPQTDWEISLGLPQTRIAHRVQWSGSEKDTWLYTGLLGMGGGTYAVQRADGVDDQLTINGFPLALGLEKRGGAATWFIESGLVVGRKLEYENSREEEDLGEGFYARVGMRY